MPIAIIGAGMVGVSCAWALRRRGQEVILLDRGDPGGQTSHGNAGVISPTSLLPLNHPGLWLQLPDLLRGRNPGFRLRSTPLRRRLPALLGFLGQARPSVLEVTAQALHRLISLSRPLHAQWMKEAAIAHRLRDEGWLFLYRSSAAWQSAAWARDWYRRFDLLCQALDAQALRELEPDLHRGFVHALWVRGAASVDEPGAVVRALAEHLVGQGLRFVRDEVRHLQRSGAAWLLQTASGQRIEADQVVLALGPGSRDFLYAQWGWKLPMLHERGYHQHYAWQGRGLRRPIYDTAGAYVLSPMTPGLRLTTGVELEEADAPPRTDMMEAAEAAARQVLPLGARLDSPMWLGSRPTLPDSRPILGAAPDHPGLWLALGHQHIGFSTGPGSGELMAALLLGEKVPIDPEPFAALRWGRHWLR
jgi:D-amino-acid dehydrogenase